MKKQTKITQDKKQTRSTIPKEFVEEFKITKKNKIEWESRRNKLIGRLINDIIKEGDLKWYKLNTK